MKAVTSFSKKGFEQYGWKLMGSIKKWPGKVIVYTEQPLGLVDVEERNLFAIPNIGTFLNYINPVPIAHGMTDVGYNYNYDLWKFCRKMFCQYDLIDEGEPFYWVDADIEIKKKIPNKYLVDLFQDNPLAFFGREGLYTETGLVGFNVTHPDFKDFAERYKQTLQKGEVFNLKRWHDCECFDHARQGLGRNLTPTWDYEEAKRGEISALDVMGSHPINEYITHRKGNRKSELAH